LVSPVQRVTDFLSERPTPVDGGSHSDSSYYGAGMSFKIPSSYRMGVIGAACHTIYPDYVTKALQKALLNFEGQLPGFITPGKITTIYNNIITNNLMIYLYKYLI